MHTCKLENCFKYLITTLSTVCIDQLLCCTLTICIVVVHMNQLVFTTIKCCRKQKISLISKFIELNTFTNISGSYYIRKNCCKVSK